MDPTTDLTYDYTTDPTTDALTVTVSDAAKLLGLSSEAVRMRVKRGTLASTRIAGSVYVVIDRPNPEPHGPNDGPNPRPNGPVGEPNGRTNGQLDAGAGSLLAAKDETISHLRRELDARNEELRRKDTIIMTLAQRIPELPSALSGEPRDGHETTSRGSSDGVEESPVNSEGAQKDVRRPWWRSIFGG